MIEIGNTIVSRELIETKFVCDLNACKGACCVLGDAGAPLEKEETDILKTIFPVIRDYLSDRGVNAIEKQGTHVVDSDNEEVTPLIEGKECAYVVFDKNNVAKCGIEQAYNDGKIKFKKPISCHLYPVRVNEHKNFTAVNYHNWHICKSACDCGSKLDVKTFKFLKEPLVRKFGEDWYNQLEEVDKYLST